MRTPDPLLARQVLSQLSYTPKNFTTVQIFGGSACPALKFTKIYFCLNFIDWVHPHSIIIKYLLLI